MSAKSAKAKEKQPETLIYCGPTIRNGELQQNSVFQGELPEHVKKHFSNAAIQQLFVSPSDFTKVKKNITKEGTLENQLYRKALEYAKGGNK
jgi:hypothetical protein